MSQIRADNITNRQGTGAPIFVNGIRVTGLTSISDMVANTGTFNGAVSIGGTLTYEDVTNIDSVGLITARSGIKVLAGGIDAVGVVTGTSLSGDIPNVTGFDQLTAPHGSTVTYTVKVASKTAAHRYLGQGSALGYKINDVEAPFLTLTPGRVYRFDQADSSNSNHQLKFYLKADKTSLFSTGVTVNGTAGSSGAYTEITVSDSTPVVLHYQCVNHGYMGNSVNVNSNPLMAPQSSPIVPMAANDVDCSLGNYFTKTITTSTTFTFSNVPAGVAFGFTMEVTLNGSNSIAWPIAVKWNADTAPTLTDGKTQLFMFITDDGGTRWRGSALVDYVN